MRLDWEAIWRAYEVFSPEGYIYAFGVGYLALAFVLGVTAYYLMRRWW